MAPVSRRSWNWAANGGLDSAMGVGGSKGRDMVGGGAGGALYRDGCFSGPFQLSDGQTEAGVFVLGSLPTGELVAGGRDRLLK